MPTPTPANDDELRPLLKATARGSRAALDEVFRREHRRLFGYLRRLSGCATEADDLVQMTFVDLWHYRRHLARCDRPRSYLYSVATRAWQRHRRQGNRRRELFDTFLEQRSTPDPISPMAAVESAELQDRLWSVLATLPAEQRVALVLHRFEGFSTRQIGVMFDVSHKTIESRLRLALERVLAAFAREELDR